MRNSGWFVSWYLAVRAIRRGNRGTLALTILIIALVVVLMNFLSMIIGGVTATYNQQMIDYQYGHLTIEPRDKMTSIENADALVDRIRRIPGVKGVTARFSTGVTLTNPDNGKFLSQSLTSYNPEDEKTVTYFQDRIVSGDFLSNGDTGQILIGVLVAGNEDEAKDKVPSLGGVKVGDSLQVTFSNGVVKNYRVKGIFETEGVLIDSSVFITQAGMDEVIQGGGMATAVLVRGHDAADAEELKYTCMQYGVQEPIKTWSEKGKGILGDAISSFSVINNLMTIVSLIVASVVVFIITFINIVNRKKQIAILKAIGIRPRIIVGSYLVQVMFLCTCGAAAGILMLSAIAYVLTIHQIKFPMGYITPVISLTGLCMSIISLYLVSLVSGYIPAWQVSKEEILDAMRG
ncbi:MAG: FtsX-like permease family protein [Methanoregula sp.]|jgi:putative ABC transport system permease protein